MIPPLDNELNILDTLKVADTVLFLISAAAGTEFGAELIDDWGNDILLSAFAQVREISINNNVFQFFLWFCKMFWNIVFFLYIIYILVKVLFILQQIFWKLSSFNNHLNYYTNKKKYIFKLYKYIYKI